ncbi:MAG: TolC family protein, partial [Rhizobiaceae bacterium]
MTGMFAALLAASALFPAAASAETLIGAMTKAYQYNSTLNQARAGVRVTDEGVAIAKSGYRPVIAGSASATHSASSSGGFGQHITTGQFGIQIQQSLFDGFQTKNNVSAAESRVRASVENLKNTEQNTLFDAASAFVDVLRDRQIAALREKNLKFLSEQVRAARSRFEVGEGTRTDVAQAEASRSAAEAQLAGARAAAASSAAIYQQVVGDP